MEFVVTSSSLKPCLAIHFYFEICDLVGLSVGDGVELHHFMIQQNTKTPKIQNLKITNLKEFCHGATANKYPFFYWNCIFLKLGREMLQMYGSPKLDDLETSDFDPQIHQDFGIKG